ncbi:MAG TPA: hypothetical protein VEW07_09710 [Solirubrobacterales bacterium]|nr:hypothetical protein [Solirubrobacterales bacterium]
MYKMALDASGMGFFDRLREYHKLITEDEAIRGGIEQIRAEVEKSKKQAEDEDGEFVRNLVACRDRLTELAPEVDDSDVPRPIVALDHGQEMRAWPSTLAYFDAIVASESPVPSLGFDESRSRILCQILDSKLHDGQLADTFQSPGEPGDRLRELRNAFGLARDGRDAAQKRWRDLAQANGYRALQRIEIVTVPEKAGWRVGDADVQAKFVEEVIARERGALGELREAMLPLDERSSDVDTQSESIKKHEEGSREDLENLQLALRPRLESKWRSRRAWDRLSDSEKAGIVVAVIVGICSAAVAIIAAP